MHGQPTTIERCFGPGLREVAARQQLLAGFRDLQVTVEDDLIAEADMQRHPIPGEATGHRGRQEPHRRGAASAASREGSTATMAHPNEELLRSYFKAAESGDLATLDKLFADNIRAHGAGDYALAGDYQGKEAVLGFFGQLAERSASTARLQLQDAVTDDWFAVALVEAAGRGRRRDARR